MFQVRNVTGTTVSFVDNTSLMINWLVRERGGGKVIDKRKVGKV